MVVCVCLCQGLCLSKTAETNANSTTDKPATNTAGTDGREASVQSGSVPPLKKQPSQQAIGSVCLLQPCVGE
jgi:hypothetical protein